MSRVFGGALALSFFSLLAAGCGDSLSLLPASGTVTYNGKPLEGALVTFLSEDNKLGSGTTDAAGKYVITTLGKSGAVAGKHQVAITKSEGGGAAPAGLGGQSSTPPSPEQIQKMIAETKSGMMGSKTKQVLNAKYANPSSSGFTADVQPGKATFDFTLTD